MRRSRVPSATIAALLIVSSATISCQRAQVPGHSRVNPANPRAARVYPADTLHNVHALGAAIISGAVPDSPAAFDELRAMGVKTIISVDGATPDVAAASDRGMRYVHLPVTYAQITPEQQLAIARAIRDLPGPVYLHCHHGKHRGPAAAAAAAVALGMVTPQVGIAFMQRAGTAPSYSGLYACVANASAAEAPTLDNADAEFPSIHRAQGMVAAMIEADEAFENLAAIRDAAWTTPPNHPDLVPAAEAGRLADNLGFSGEDSRSAELGSEYMARLSKAIDLASALEEATVRGEPAEALEAAYQAVNASCKDCHALYRDKPLEAPRVPASARRGMARGNRGDDAGNGRRLLRNISQVPSVVANGRMRREHCDTASRHISEMIASNEA